MNKQHDADGTLNHFKNVNPVKQMEIVAGAVDAILANLSAIDASRKSITKAEGSQMTVLKNALKDYPEPITEEAWDKVFKANVTARLSEAKVGGIPRYKNPASRDVMVNLIKVATMGITLAKHERRFEPSDKASRNLKKYADEVRSKLQNAIDPATEKPRLRSIAIAPKKEKKLPAGSLYLLIGCEDGDKGIEGANTVIGASSDLDKLVKTARKLSTKFADFLYVPAPPLEPLDWEEKDLPVELAIQNSAVFSQTLSPPSEQVLA